MASTATGPPALEGQETALTSLVNRRRLIDLGVVLLIAVVPSILSAVHSWLYPSSHFSSNWGLIGGLLHQFSAMVLFAYVLSRQGRKWASVGFDWRWSDLLIGALLCIAALALLMILSSLITASTYLIFARAPDMRHPDRVTGIFSGLLIAYSISSPIFEETLVRGYFTTELLATGRPLWVATLASIVLQTSYHIYYGLAGALSISALFIVFALYFAMTRRVFPVMLAHLYWDLTLTLSHLHH